MKALNAGIDCGEVANATEGLPNGVPVLDVVFVAAILALMALVALIAKGVERL